MSKLFEIYIMPHYIMQKKLTFRDTRLQTYLSTWEKQLVLQTNKKTITDKTINLLVNSHKLNFVRTSGMCLLLKSKIITKHNIGSNTYVNILIITIHKNDYILSKRALKPCNALLNWEKGTAKQSTNKAVVLYKMSSLIWLCMYHCNNHCRCMQAYSTGSYFQDITGEFKKCVHFAKNCNFAVYWCYEMTLKDTKWPTWQMSYSQVGSILHIFLLLFKLFQSSNIYIWTNLLSQNMYCPLCLTK